MMIQNTKNKEQKIYKQLIDLKKGTDGDKSLAFDCIGILGNESTQESFESRLNNVENLIQNHLKRTESNK